MFAVDRIENHTAVCIDENDRLTAVDVSEFNEPVHEGDLVYKCAAGVWHVDDIATQKRRAMLKARLARLVGDE